MILAGDIGGTSTRLALFENGRMMGIEKKYASADFKSLEEILVLFLQGKRVERACFGVAGPVVDQKSRITNLPWLIEAAAISQSFQIPWVHLLNDLEANAYGIAALKSEELLLLHPGIEQKGNQALIAAGTGLGEACLYWDGQRHRPFPCEGGHVDFAPRNEREVELFLYLKKKYDHVSYERVVSGPGLLALFYFLIDTGRGKLSAAVKKAMETEDPAKVISEWGSKDRDPVCIEALDWFLSLYGSEAGNMALKFFALGGVFVGGGIAPHLVDKMKEGIFRESFINKGRFRALLEKIPLRIIVNDNAALLGAAKYAEQA